MRNKSTLSLTAVATLALGVGTSVAVLTIAETLLLRPLPVTNEQRIVLLWGETPDRKFANVPLTLSELESFQRQTRTLERVAYHTFRGASPVTFRAGDQPLRLDVSLVSGNYFDVLGAAPALGRALGAADDMKGVSPVLVLSYRSWRQRFGGDSAIIGRSLVNAASGRSYRIVGVMRPGLDYPTGTDVWTPLTAYSMAEGFHDIAIGEVDIVARLSDGATTGQARSELTSFFAGLPAAGWRSEARGVAYGFRDVILGDTRPAMRIVLLASVMLLVVGCINVANLQLVRSLGRANELVVRAALGASRAQLVRHQLREAVLLSTAGGLAGTALASILVTLFLRIAPAGLPRVHEISLDETMLLAALGVSAITALAAGLAPALFALRIDAGDALRAGMRNSDGPRLRLAGELLVGTQVAMAVVALASAGLVGRSLLNLYRVDMAFDPAQLTVAELVLRQGQPVDRDQQAGLISRIVSRLESVPGVAGVTPVLNVPFIAGTGGIDGRFPVPGQSVEEHAKNPVVNMEVVAPSYFSVLGVPVLQGRPFTDDDRVGSTRVVIVSVSTARALWPDRDAVGQRLGSNGEFTVVGVIPDLRYRELQTARPSVYFPLAQPMFPMTPTTLVMRGDHTPLNVAHLRAAIAEVGAGVTIALVTTIEDLLASPRAQPRLNTVVLGLFATGAVILAAIGMFSVMATMVRRRTRELGIRMALGATRANVGRMVLRRGVVIASLGTIAGLLGARSTGTLLSSLLFEVTPTDSLTFLSVAVAVIAIAALASFFPARAGASVDPAQSLRSD